MFVLNGIAFDLDEGIQDRFRQSLMDTNAPDKQLMVDWTRNTLNPNEIIDQYLPIVQFAHSLGYTVEVKIPVKLISQFAYQEDPIVFCGHTLNPFAFDKVDVILE